MKFLLTNDDGILAPGLQALGRELAKLGEVYVCAPDHNCSANSHHLTMKDPIAVQETEVCGAVCAWAVNGTPADCVHLALSTLLPEPIDVVVSGINRGTNLSTDCLYSGTVAAAAEGYILGRPALAVSLDSFDAAADYKPAAEIGARMARYIVEKQANLLLNVNVPARPKTEILGEKLTCIDRIQRYPQDNYTWEEKDGKKLYRFVAAPFEEEDLSHDVRAVREGWVSVTPLTCFWSDAACLKELAADFEKD